MAATASHTRTYSDKKLHQIEELAGLIRDSSIIGIVKISGVGTRQIYGVKKSLRGQASVKIVKNTMVRKAIEKAGIKKKDVEKLIPLLVGQNAYIFTNLSPYRLSVIFSKSKVKAPAKAGSIAISDVLVPAGNTGFTPGPVISQLNEVGLPTRVESGSIWITKDAVVARKGDKISQNLAIILSRLGIEPFEVQLRLACALENGEIIASEALDIDEEKIISQLREAHRSAINLSVNAGILNTETIPLILAKAEGEARVLHTVIVGKKAK